MKCICLSAQNIIYIESKWLRLSTFAANVFLLSLLSLYTQSNVFIARWSKRKVAWNVFSFLLWHETCKCFQIASSSLKLFFSSSFINFLSISLSIYHFVYWESKMEISLAPFLPEKKKNTFSLHSLTAMLSELTKKLLWVKREMRKVKVVQFSWKIQATQFDVKTACPQFSW